MTQGDGYVPVAALSSFPDSGILPVEVDDRFVVLVKVDGHVFCMDDVCTHDGGPLSEGDLENSCLICPRHGAKFDVRTGQALTMPATEPTTTHQVKILDDHIWVKLASATR